MKVITTYLTISALLFGLLVNGQEVYTISLEEAKAKVREKNKNLQISEEDFLAARAQFQQSRAVFLPHISLSHTGMTTNNPLIAFGSRLNQEKITQSDFDPSRLNNPDRIDHFATKLEVEQPLINLDGIFQRKAAKNKMQASDLQRKRTTDAVLLEVEKAYMELQLAQKAVTVLEQALQTARANKKLADDNFRQGYLQKSDVLAVEIRVTEVGNQLQYARSNIQNASDYLNFLMGASGNNILLPSDELSANLTPQGAMEFSQDRADIQALEKATEARKQVYTAEKMTYLPRLNAFGSYEMYDDKVFQGNASGYLAGITLTWDIFNGSQRIAKIQERRAEYEKAQLQFENYLLQNEMEYHKAQRALKDTENKLHLTELAMEQSKEALRIRNNRYEQGLEKTTDLLMAETQFSEKQLEYYQTVYEYNYALAYLKFLADQQEL